MYWTDNYICLNTLDGKLQRKYSWVSNDEGLANDMMLLPRYQYLAIGLRSGYIIVCKYFKTLSVMFNIKAHLKAVLTLVQHPTCSNMILSGSTDGFIRVWNVEVNYVN